MKNRRIVKTREFADFPDSLGSPLHSVRAFGILFSSVRCPPACSFAVFRRSQHKARPPMRISGAILAVLAFVAAPMAAEAYVISATDFMPDIEVITSVEYTTGKSAHFKQGDGTEGVIATSSNSIFADEIAPPGSYSGGIEFGVNDEVPTLGTPGPGPGNYASIWGNLPLNAPSNLLSEVLGGVDPDDAKQILMITFDDLVKSINVTFTLYPGSQGNSGDNDADFGFLAFGADNMLLTDSNQVKYSGDAVSLTVEFSPIDFVVKTLLIGADTSSSATVGITSISFEFEESLPPDPPVVPEPASAALALFGLAGAYFGRRRLMAAA